MTAAANPAATAPERLRPIAVRVLITMVAPHKVSNEVRFSPGPVSPLTPRDLLDVLELVTDWRPRINVSLVTQIPLSNYTVRC